MPRHNFAWLIYHEKKNKINIKRYKILDKDFPCFDKNGNMTEMRFHYKMKVIFFIPYIISKLNNDFPT